ncbi:MAG: hypothetical protein IKT89_03940 [Clostridia bacterium]|nr:hypothetical protein [Clostridia bacterium]
MNNLIGKIFGELTVIKRVENDKNNRTQWLCKCSCGREKIIRGSSLTSGNSKTCGCQSGKKKTQELYGSRLYRVWANIKSRCTNPNYPRFKDYGGRGIALCESWLIFENFKCWALSNGYTDKLTIDRIDNNGNYEPNNCRWVTQKINNTNKRNNLIFTYKNKSMCLKKWAEELNIDYILLYNRVLRRNWDFEKAITTPLMENRRNRNAKYG